jgi:hypothetical protein
VLKPEKVINASSPEISDVSAELHSQVERQMDMKELVEAGPYKSLQGIINYKGAW